MEIAILYTSHCESLANEAFALGKKLQLPQSWIIDVSQKRVPLHKSQTVIMCCDSVNDAPDQWPNSFLREKKSELQEKKLFLYTCPFQEMDILLEK